MFVFFNFQYIQKFFFLFLLLSSMYFDSEESGSKADDQSKTVYIYENSCNNKEPIEYRIRNQTTTFKDIARILKFKKLRLFNEEGAQYFEDDLRFVKNKTSLYASKGQQFDPHNCFGQYEIVNKLGQGGFGQVFLANHKHSGDKCAIKIIKISSASDIDSIFVQAQILKSLKHENIVKVTNCLTLKNMQVAIIMQYLEGGQLLQYVQKQGRLDQQTCKIFLRQIVKGIMYCHQNNLIHRDLKLENVVLVNSEEKKIKIIDFGIAGVMSRLTEQDLDAGSLGYMAPQCFFANVASSANEPNFKFDGRMDIWAIGVILYGMLCAQLPFKGATNHQIKQNIKKGYYKLPSQVKKSLSKQCLNVIFRCLDPNPKSRIKIGQLIAHDWFIGKNKMQIPQQKTVTMNLTALPNQNDNEDSGDNQVKNTENKQRRPSLKQKQVLAPIKQDQQNVKVKKKQQLIKSKSKNKNTTGIRSAGSSLYKSKGNQKTKGKQNTLSKLKV